MPPIPALAPENAPAVAFDPENAPAPAFANAPADAPAVAPAEASAVATALAVAPPPVAMSLRKSEDLPKALPWEKELELLYAENV